MRIVIVGGHGQIARQLGRLTTEHGHDVVGLVRSVEQGPDLEADGMSWQLLDLEDTSLEEMRMKRSTGCASGWTRAATTALSCSA